MIVKDILYKWENLGYYGLNVIFKLDDNKTLLFDSLKFSFVDDLNLNNRWKYLPHCNDKLLIEGIYEDEITSYFVQFSNGYIFYIYQYLDGDEDVTQDFKIVKPGDSDYNEVVEYMNEDWIDVWYCKSDSIDRIAIRSINQIKWLYPKQDIIK